VVGFTSYLLYPMAQPAVSIEKQFQAPQSQSGHFKKRKISCPCWESYQFLGLYPNYTELTMKAVTISYSEHAVI